MKTATHTLIVHIVAALLAISAGCTSVSVERRLQAAEALIETYPDSALTILRAIDRSDLGDEHRARCALLLSQAYDKSLIDIADDSLISIAFDYYSRPSAPDSYRIPAHYYRATVAFNAEDYPSAIFHAIVADTLASIAGDLHYRGMANNLIALSYSRLGDYDKELKYAVKSHTSFKDSNDSLRSRVALMNLGVCYLELKHYEKAFEILTDPDCKEWPPGIAEALIRTNRLSEYRDFIQNHPELTSSPRLNSIYAIALIGKGNFHEADSLIKVARRHSVNFSDSSSYIMAESEFLFTTEQWKKFSQIAIDANQHGNRWLHKVYSEYDSRGQLLAHEYIRSLEAEGEHHHRQRLILTIVSLTIILIVVILVGINQRTIHAKRLLEKELMIRNVIQENTSANNLIHSLSENIQKLQAEHKSDNRRETSSASSSTPRPTLTEEERNSLASFIANIKESLHALCNRHQHTSSSDKAAITGIMRDIQAILTPDTVRCLEQYIDALFDGLAHRARKGGFPDKDILLLSLIKLGFTNSEIALFFDTSYQTVAKRKSRLLRRLAEAGIIDQ